MLNNDIKPLYEAIEGILGIQYPVTWQHMEEDKENVVGIYLYESSADRKYLSGDYQYESIKVQVQVQSENTDEGLFAALKYLREFVDKMENEYVDTDKVSFEDCEHIGPKAVTIGTNEYGLKVCRSVVDVKYLLN